MYICKKCGKGFEKRHAYIGHCSVHSRVLKIKEVKIHSCKFCGKIFEMGVQLGGHTSACLFNPGRVERSRKLSEAGKRFRHTDESKHHLSELMKQRHKDGKAWNIGQSRWNNKPSYPEEFFAKVIENEFENKNYNPEYNVGIYSIDFAWVELKKAIEIDGEQHERFEDVIARDKRKDLCLIENGWSVLRIKWKDMFHNTKEKIEEAKRFINIGI